MSTQECKKILIQTFPTSLESDWKRVRKYKQGSDEIREFENKKTSQIVHIKQDSQNQLSIISSPSTVKVPTNSGTNKVTSNTALMDSTCPLIASAQELKSIKEYRNFWGQSNDVDSFFDTLKILPQLYYFQINVGSMSDYGDEDERITLDCNKLLSELEKEDKRVYISIVDQSGTWYDDNSESIIQSIVCPSLLGNGDSEGALDVLDNSISTNDLVAYLERRGLGYVKNNWADIKMQNFRSKVNDSHPWAFSNPDLSPTKDQMWQIVKDLDYQALLVYAKFLDTSMLEHCIKNEAKLYDHRLKEYVKKAYIKKEKENLDLSTNSARKPLDEKSFKL